MAEFDLDGFNREVGLRMQLARKRANMTQAEVSARVGIPRASYANLESGRQRIPIDLLWRAAIVTKSTLAALIPTPQSQRELSIIWGNNSLPFGLMFPGNASFCGTKDFTNSGGSERG